MCWTKIVLKVPVVRHFCSNLATAFHLPLEWADPLFSLSLCKVLSEPDPEGSPQRKCMELFERVRSEACWGLSCGLYLNPRISQGGITLKFDIDVCHFYVPWQFSWLNSEYTGKDGEADWMYPPSPSSFIPGFCRIEVCRLTRACWSRSSSWGRHIVHLIF